jgi:ABC-type nitrate/sulfonate/bicarbonate transport system substrate-binding protein
MPDKVVVGTVSRTFFTMPVWIAIENGYFAAEGLDVSVSVFGNASQVPPLIDGSFQIVIGSPEGAMQNAASGGPLRIVAGNAGKLVHSLIARSPFGRIEDLRGATIGILSQVEGTFFHVKTMLAAHGLHYPGDYTVKESGGVPPRHNALLEGSIDAGLQSVPWNYVAEEAGMHNLGDVVDYVPDWQFVSVNANNEWAAANRDTVVRLLRAMLRGTEWLYGNRAKSARVAVRELPAPAHHAERAWDFFTRTNALTRDMSVNMVGLGKVIELLMTVGLLPPDAPKSPSFYVEDDYLRKARAGGA